MQKAVFCRLAVRFSTFAELEEKLSPLRKALKSPK